MSNPLKVSLENIIPLTEARDHFSQIVNEVQKDKLYVLTKGGKPAVAIIDVKYLERITGGEIKEEHIQEEIKKFPQKVGLPPMVEHQQSPTPPLAPPAPKIETPPVNTNTPNPFNSQTPKPEPAGFAAPQPPKPTPPPPAPAQLPIPPLNPTPPIQNSGPTPLKTPSLDDNDKIDIKATEDHTEENTKRTNGLYHSDDDQVPPAQYAGKSDGEPEDMSID